MKKTKSSTTKKKNQGWKKNLKSQADRRAHESNLLYITLAENRKGEGRKIVDVKLMRWVWNWFAVNANTQRRIVLSLSLPLFILPSFLILFDPFLFLFPPPFPLSSSSFSSLSSLPAVLSRLPVSLSFCPTFFQFQTSCLLPQLPKADSFSSVVFEFVNLAVNRIFFMFFSFSKCFTLLIIIRFNSGTNKFFIPRGLLMSDARFLRSKSSS